MGNNARRRLPSINIMEEETSLVIMKNMKKIPCYQYTSLIPPKLLLYTPPFVKKDHMQDLDTDLNDENGALTWAWAWFLCGFLFPSTGDLQTEYGVENANMYGTGTYM